MSQPVPVVPNISDDIPIHTRRVLLAMKTTIEYLLTQTGVRAGRAGSSAPAAAVSASFTHNAASGLQGGTSGQYYHLTQVQLSGLTGGANTTLHYHEADRALESATGVLPWDQVDKTGATLADFDSITHNDINSIQGGSASERYHLTAAQWTATTQGVDNTIHFHSSDRALGNATGVLPWAQISGVPDHNDLTNSQGGTTDEYYHLTSAEYTGSGTGVFARVTGAEINPTSIGATTAGSGAFTTLSTSGSVTLGDDSADTVYVRGRAAVGGGGSPLSFTSTGFAVVPTELSGASQTGILARPTASSSATGSTTGVDVQPRTAAASFTTGSMIGLKLSTPVIGSGSAVTNLWGILVQSQAAGTNNFGIECGVAAGSNNWNIYVSGTAKNYFNGAILVGTTADDGTNKLQVSGSASVTGDITGGDDLILPKTSGKGIKVDTASPTFGWKDLLGTITVKGVGGGGAGANPDYVVYRGSIYAYRWGTVAPNNHLHEAFIEFHIPHDYVPGTDMYIHIHWSQTTVDTGGTAGVPGVAKWYFDISYADGHGTPGGAADPFIAPITVSVTQQGSTTQYGHMIAEVVFTDNGTSLIDRSAISVDGVLLVRAYRDPADAADTLDQDTFVHFIDVHYQSTGMATKNKSPDFYA